MILTKTSPCFSPKKIFHETADCIRPNSINLIVEKIDVRDKKFGVENFDFSAKPKPTKEPCKTNKNEAIYIFINESVVA